MHLLLTLFYLLSVSYFGMPAGYWTFSTWPDYSSLPCVSSTYKMTSLSFGPLVVSETAAPTIQPIHQILAPSDDSAIDILVFRATKPTPLNMLEPVTVEQSKEPASAAEDAMEIFYKPFRELPSGHLLWNPSFLLMKLGRWPAGINSDNGFVRGPIFDDAYTESYLFVLAKKHEWNAADRTIVLRRRDQRQTALKISEPELIIQPMLWYFDPDTRAYRLDFEGLTSWTNPAGDGVAVSETVESKARRTFLEFMVEYQERPRSPQRGFPDTYFYR